MISSCSQYAPNVGNNFYLEIFILTHRFTNRKITKTFFRQPAEDSPEPAILFSCSVETYNLYLTSFQQLPYNLLSSRRCLCQQHLKPFPAKLFFEPFEV